MRITKNHSFSGTDCLGMGQNNRSNQDNAPAGPTDELLLERCRRGEFAAFGQLIEKYQNRLFNSLMRMVNNYDDAQELTQETFVRALQGIRKFRGNSGFYTWLFRIGMNLAINFHRRRKTVKFTSLQTSSEHVGQQADGLLNLIDSEAPSPEDRVQGKEEHQRVLEALDELEPPARAVVVLRDIEEFDYAEIAAILEIPIGTVKSRLARARMSIRAKLS
jgi:RNA polymerase sigma-70 factor (ECF subfamily)